MLLATVLRVCLRMRVSPLPTGIMPQPLSRSPRGFAAFGLSSLSRCCSAAGFLVRGLWPCLWLACCVLLFSPTAASALAVRAAILMNASTGQIIYEKNAAAPIPPASLAKVMNMFLAMDAVAGNKTSLAQRVRISADVARTGGSSMHLRQGDSVSLRALLTGMAVASGNDAARAVARVISGTERRHVSRMNARAKALGMRRTAFKNVTGLPAGGQTTCARDMLLMARAYLRRHPQAAVFHNTRTLRHNARTLYNTNKLLGAVPGVNGLKTGYTGASGYNVIVTAQRG